jgi:hypothetical protein
VSLTNVSSNDVSSKQHFIEWRFIKQRFIEWRLVKTMFGRMDVSPTTHVRTLIQALGPT